MVNHVQQELTRSAHRHVESPASVQVELRICCCLCSQAKAAEKEGTGGIIHINIDKSSFGKARWLYQVRCCNGNGRLFGATHMHTLLCLGSRKPVLEGVDCRSVSNVARAVGKRFCIQDSYNSEMSKVAYFSMR